MWIDLKVLDCAKTLIFKTQNWNKTTLHVSSVIIQYCFLLLHAEAKDAADTKMIFFLDTYLRSFSTIISLELIYNRKKALAHHDCKSIHKDFNT